MKKYIILVGILILFVAYINYNINNNRIKYEYIDYLSPPQGEEVYYAKKSNVVL